MYPAPVIEAAMAAAELAFPAESCGLIRTVAGEAAYQTCDNIASDPLLAFDIDSAIVLAAQKDNTLLAVVHSHPDPAPACPSAADMAAQANMDIPWGIVPVINGQAAQPFWWGTRETRPWTTGTVDGLIGLPYRHGVTDCYSLVRDYYEIVHRLDLPDQPRGWCRLGPDVNGQDWYSLLYQELGFEDVPLAEARVGDGLLLQIGRSVINHSGVIIEHGVMLHHPGGLLPWDPARLSRRDPVSRWQPHLRKVVRHRSMADG